MAWNEWRQTAVRQTAVRQVRRRGRKATDKTRQWRRQLRLEALEDRRLLANSVPAITSLQILPTLENEVATLSGAFADGDGGDQHRVCVQWGDGTSQILDLATGERTFTAQHTYLQDGGFPVSVSVSDRPLTLGLVGLWNFDDAAATDASGFGQNGTVGSSLTFDADVPSTLGSGQSLTAVGTVGTAGIVQIPNAGHLETMRDQLTVAFWVKADTTTAAWSRIVRKGSEGSAARTWLVDRYGSSTETNVRVDTVGAGGVNNQNIAVTGVTVLDGTW